MKRIILFAALAMMLAACNEKNEVMNESNPSALLSLATQQNSQSRKTSGSLRTFPIMSSDRKNNG